MRRGCSWGPCKSAHVGWALGVCNSPTHTLTLSTAPPLPPSPARAAPVPGHPLGAVGRAQPQPQRRVQPQPQHQRRGHGRRAQRQRQRHLPGCYWRCVSSCTAQRVQWARGRRAPGGPGRPPPPPPPQRAHHSARAGLVPGARHRAQVRGSQVFRATQTPVGAPGRVPESIQLQWKLQGEWTAGYAGSRSAGSLAPSSWTHPTQPHQFHPISTHAHTRITGLSSVRRCSATWWWCAAPTAGCVCTPRCGLGGGRGRVGGVGRLGRLLRSGRVRGDGASCPRPACAWS